MKSRNIRAGARAERCHRDCYLDDALSKSGTEFLCVAVPKAFGAIAQLVLNLLLIRVLGPEQAGVVFVCLTAILLFDAVLGSALDVAILRLATGHVERNQSDGLDVQKAAILVKLAGCLAVAVPITVWAGPFSRVIFHTSEYWPLLPLCAVALLGLLLLRSVQTGFQVSRRFVQYGLTDVLHSGLKFGGFGVLLAVQQVTPISIVALHLAAPLAVSLLMLCTASRNIVPTEFPGPALKRLLGVVKWYAGGAIAGSITSRIDIFLISIYAGSVQAGLFSAAQTFTVPFQLVGMYLGVVFAPRIMPLWEQGRLTSVFRRFQTWAIAASIACYAAGVAGASLISGWLLPDSFSGTSLLIVLLLPSSLTALVNFPWTVPLLMFSHARFLMVFDLCALAVLSLVYWQCIIRFGAVGACVVTSVFAVVKTAVLQLVAINTLKRRPRADDGSALFVDTARAVPAS